MTAEEYVVQRIQELEQRSKMLAKERDGSRASYEEARKALESVCKKAKVKNSGNIKSIMFNTLWSDDEPAIFKFLVDEHYVKEEVEE